MSGITKDDSAVFVVIWIGLRGRLSSVVVAGTIAVFKSNSYLYGNERTTGVPLQISQEGVCTNVLQCIWKI
jgi:hypothetical protein